jgi:hypothetical protein
MVQQYVGNAIRLAYSAEANCISDFVINKREQEKKKLVGLTSFVKAFPFFKDIMQEREPIEDDEFETEELFMNTT